MSLYVETGIVERILAIPAVAAITTTVRVDAMNAGEAYPAVIVTMSEMAPEDVLQGFNGQADIVLEVRSLATTKTAARQLDYLIQHGREDALGASDGLVDWSGTAGGVAIDDVTWLGTSTREYDPEDGDVAWLFEVVSRYRARQQGHPIRF